MSLLLDAIKKAEQEKAEKEADKSNSAEQSADSSQENAEQFPVDQSQQRMNVPNNDQTDLDLDDVTEFMGDGVRAEHAGSAQDTQLDMPQKKEDSTELELTEDLLRDEDIPDDVDLAQTQPQNVESDNDGSLELEPVYQDLTLDDLENEDDGNASGAGGVSVDIDRFTSDLTIRRQDELQSKTTASDNDYSNLPKGFEQKVAEPTPTYSSATETAMTPELARKMFLRKNNSNKVFYYKIYAGISLMLLLVMAVWGLFEVESRFEQIEQGLVGLKRDPMPNAMRPRIDRSTAKPLDSTNMEADSKTKNIIAQAETFSELEADPKPGVNDASAKQKGPESKIESIQEQDAAVQTVNAGAQPINPASRVNENDRQVKAMQQSIQSAQSRPTESSIQLSSKLTVEEKDRLLQQAYAAYEADDIAQARQDYDQVLELDGLNRDGLLGRAAIHVIDEEYQAAIDKYQLILEANPNDSMALTSLISVANIDPEAGESQLKSMLREQPDTAYLHFALGNMYGTQQRWSEAQNAYFNALYLKSSDPDYAYNLAVSLEHLGKPQAAVTYYQRALNNSRELRANFDRQLVRQRIGVLAQ